MPRPYDSFLERLGHYHPQTAVAGPSRPYLREDGFITGLNDRVDAWNKHWDGAGLHCSAADVTEGDAFSSSTRVLPARLSVTDPARA